MSDAALRSGLRSGFLHQAVAAAPLALFTAMLVYIGVASPSFLTLASLTVVLEQALPVVLACAGLSIVVMAGGDDVVSGGIDLSIPATAVLAAGITAQWLAGGGSLAVAALLALGAALTVGIVNAILVTRIGMTPLLATLSMFVAGVGVNAMVTESRRIDVSHPAIIFLRDGTVAGVPAGILIVLAVSLLLYHVAHRTRFGLNLQAAGGNRDAAEVSGLDVGWLQGAAFVLAAVTGYAASFFVLARGSGSSPGVQDNLMLEMVLATFLGAAFSPRRTVTLWGALLGALLVAAITVGFKSMGVNVFWLGLIKGGLILAVVGFAALAQRDRG